MQKKIAIFLGEIAGDFQETITKVITAKANCLGYDVAIFCSYGSYNDDILYAEGEKACIYLPDCSVFDGIIVTEDMFDIPGMSDELYRILLQDARCPVVYLRTQREGFHSILVENVASIETIVRHFTDVHGFTDICYMSGKPGFIDTTERLQGYLNVMEEKGIPVTEHMIFHGDFWREKGQEAVDWFLEGRTGYPQAIVCANDYMAISVCDELRSRGIRVPEDVCVSGFDFVQLAQTFEPALTSLEVDFKGMSARAVEIIDHINHGREEPLTQRMEAKLRLNKSCGCGNQYKSSSMQIMMETNYLQIASMKSTMLSTMEYQDCFEQDEFLDVASKYRSCIRSDTAFFCFNDTQEQGFDEVENDSSFTSKMVLERIFSGKQPAQKPMTVFSRGELLPSSCWSDMKPHNYLFFSIHFKNIVYGYMAATMPKKEWFDIYTQAYLLNLANAIQNSYIHRQMEQLEEIRALYQRDALTGLYNRRGFDKLLRERFSSAREAGENLGIASIDMDNLKTINDTFGHSEGDRAIKALASALGSVLQPDEFCARMGGDEFAAVLNIREADRVLRFRTDFENALKQGDETLPDYTLSASVGILETAEDPSASLLSSLQMADMRMYEEKRAKKRSEVRTYEISREHDYKKKENKII